jgi:lipopolysaccharide/colanic/teichoic acid biosynthesis glycosyltransferase
MDDKDFSMTQSFYARTGKRWFDAACSLLGLIVLSPLLLLAALAIKLTSRGPVFFRQVRIGRYEKPFRIFKFRTMLGNGGARGPLLTAAGDPRVTRVGGWLRKTKADEFPQLINVFVGEMSLVGPRPEVPAYTAGYSEAEKAVFLIRPGITGPAANNFVHEEELLADQLDKEVFYVTTVLPAKLRIDLNYCHEIRFLQDLRIIFATFAKVFGKTAGLPKPVFGAPQKQN